jgi:hypothetical protein
MRLTLRTLLAYLDDILEPSQAKEIGDKLNESSFASSLVSRIREVMRRRRLTAPTLSGPGMGIDPNTVAEYLDNTLAPDGVADVEKICLESDVHLAEAAACHQILTLALGEPVEMSAQSRERMYALGPSAAKVELSPLDGAPHPAGANGHSGRGVADVLSQAEDVSPAHHPQKSPAPAPVIPDYLRPRSNLKKMLGYSAVALLVIAWGILMINNSPFKRTRDQSPNAGRMLVADAGSQPAEGAESPADAAHDLGSPATNGAPDESGSGTATKASVNTPRAKNAPDLDLVPPTELADDVPAPPKREGVLNGKKKRAEAAQADGAQAAAAAKPAEPDAPAPAVTQAPAWKYLSGEGVTLEYRNREGMWYTLPPRSLVHAGDQLAVPEPFRCELEAEGGKALVTIVGGRRGSIVRMLEPTDAGLIGVELKRGQFMVRSMSDDESADPLRMGVAIAGELWRLDVGPGARCGVQVNLREPFKIEEGSDKNAYDGGFYVAAGGTATVTDPAGKTHEIKGPDWVELPLLAGADGKPARKRPLESLKWMEPPALSTTLQNYSKLFEKRFSPDDAVELSIPEVAGDSNPKISQMATECLGLIDAYAPLVEILHRSRHEEARRAAISALRLWLPRNPDNAELLKAELTKRFLPNETDPVYKLLIGYDEDDARNLIISQQLIDWMFDPEISIRALAFYHVERLTGKNHNYRPNASPVAWNSSRSAWMQHLNKEKGLLPSEKPAPNPQ